MESVIKSLVDRLRSGERGINAKSLIYLRPYVESLLDLDWLQSQLDDYELWATSSSGPALQAKLLHRPLGMNVLVAGIWAARWWEAERNEDLQFAPPAGAQWLAQTALDLATLEAVKPQALTEQGRKYLRQRLQAADEVWGVLHECRVFAHFALRGVECDPTFLVNSAEYDLVVRWLGVEIPVQCKAMRPGAGRVIPEHRFINLAASIARDVKAKGERLLVEIGATDDIREEDVAFLRREVARGLGRGLGPALVTNGEKTYSVRVKSIRQTVTLEEAQDLIRGLDYHLRMVVGDPGPDSGQYTVDAIVGIKSDNDETVRPWRSLRRNIKDAAKQLRPEQPGIVAVHFTDHVADFRDWQPAGEPMGLAMAKELSNFPGARAIYLTAEPDRLGASPSRGEGRWYYKIQPDPIVSSLIDHMAPE